MRPVTEGSGLNDGGPSATARRVAAYRLGFTRAEVSYGDAAADEALAADVAAGREPPGGRMRDYLAARTRFFDRVVVGAIARRVRQIVIGAAGYDGRAFRYRKPGVHWFEVDHPATQRDKRERLERLGIAARQVRFVAADFIRDPIADLLTGAGLDPGQPSLFLLEGVAVYLEPAVLERVLGQFRQVTRPGSRLAISVSLSAADDEARSGFQASVAALGESARSTLEADEATELLARTGWEVVADADPADPAAAARRDRLRSVGLLTATAVPIGTAVRGAPVVSGAPALPGAPAVPDAAVTGAPVVPGSPAVPSAPAARAAFKSRPAPASPHQPQGPQEPQRPLSLSALLSQALVAFTIELDNEAEHRLPHRTTDYGLSSQGDGPWLVSLVMFENCLRFVTDEPITVGELETLARTGTNLDGMRRWGYITIDGAARRTYKTRPGPDSVLRATPRGLRAREAWLPLPGVIEQRWRERFGADHLGRLRRSLAAIAGQLDPGLPDCLPVLGHGLFNRGPDPGLPPRPEPSEPASLSLSALMSRVLLALALEYEAESEVSLAVGANLLRVLGAEGTRARDLPPLTGISREAVSGILGVLLRARLAVEEPDPSASRGKVAHLTARGLREQRLYLELLAKIEERWRERFGADPIGALREPLEALALGANGQPAPLFRGLEPYPDNWRASVRPPLTLPYYPMVLHRGGYPDGS
jgi:methyltransferase (TIGR00027 family)